MQKQSYFWNKSIEESKNTHFLLEEAYKALTHSEVEDALFSQIPRFKNKHKLEKSSFTSKATIKPVLKHENPKTLRKKKRKKKRN